MGARGQNSGGSGGLPRAGGVVIVGSGTAFVSGISYYTHKLANALAARVPVGVVLMRKLIPAALYPGRQRVGAAITELGYPPDVPVVDGIDWYWGPGMLRALALIARRRPRAVVFQWWTGAVLHSYIVLALWARLWRAAVVVEFHEVQDTGETQLFGAARYVELFSRALMRLAAASVIHSESDRDPVIRHYRVGDRPLAVIPHGPFDQYRAATPLREAPPEVINLLFFGTIRPYKGLEDLVEAFDSLAPERAARFWLTVVGETWEGWTGPLELIARSRYRYRITLVNRYLTDQELAGHLAGADAAVLPYRRSSASGPLHVAMSEGLPVIVTAVGGLPEAAAGYGGAIWIPPADPAAIAAALEPLAAMVGTRFEDPQSWERSADRFEELLGAITDNRG